MLRAGGELQGQTRRWLPPFATILPLFCHYFATFSPRGTPTPCPVAGDHHGDPAPGSPWLGTLLSPRQSALGDAPLQGLRGAGTKPLCQQAQPKVGEEEDGGDEARGQRRAEDVAGALPAPGFHGWELLKAFMAKGGEAA